MAGFLGRVRGLLRMKPKCILSSMCDDYVVVQKQSIADLAVSKGFILTNRDIIIPTVFEVLADIKWTFTAPVTPVKDQGEFCTCWAFPPIAAVEGINGQRIRKCSPPLAEQELIDSCFSTLERGYPTKGLNYILKNGISEEKHYPYVGFRNPKWMRNILAKNRGKMPRVYIKGWSILKSQTDAAISLVALQQPVCVTLKIPNEDIQGYSEEIYCGPDPRVFYPEREIISHCMTIVGYGSYEGIQFWVLKNSWGDSWGGLGGFMLIQRNTGIPGGVCGINQYVCYPTN